MTFSFHSAPFRLSSRASVWLVVVGLGFAATGRSETLAARVLDTSVITPHPGRYAHGWPTVARLKNGDLMVVWSGGRDSHACPFGRLESMVSHDQGKTWSWPRVLWDSAIDDRDGGVLETAKGTLLVTTFGSVGYAGAGKREKYARAPEDWRRFEGAGLTKEMIGEAGPRIMRSEDGGLTWSTAEKVPMNSPHGPIQLADGRLLYPGVEGVGKGPYIQPGERKVGAWESRDDARSWKLLSLIPARPGDDPVHYHELHGVEAADGTIVVLIRSHADSKGRMMLQTESKDGGRTWSPLRALNFVGYPPHLLRLRDGRLLLSYDHRQAPFGVQVRLSENHGATWSEPVIISQNATKLDQGYPSSVEQSDGSFLTVWYEEPVEETRAVLKQARWTLPPRP